VRIVGGEWKGRIIRPPSDDRVRPTADRVREAWMSIVLPWIPGATVLDLFAGSGALGLEALSRGAASADFVEIAGPSLRALKQNIETLGATSVRVHKSDAVRFVADLGASAYDIAFVDPPYGLGLADRIVRTWLNVPFAEILGVEHAARDPIPEGGNTRRYGDTALTFYRCEAES
jgi:16S rRNA (guanine966-N2)-methyltransferase